MTVEAFQSFVRDFDPAATFSSPRSVEMVFSEEDFSARTTLSTDDATVVTDVYVLDASAYDDGVRRSLVRALLAINGAAVRGSNFSVGIDDRSFLVLTGRLPLAGLVGTRFGAAMMFWLDQALRLRECAEALSFQAADLSYDFATTN